MSLGVLRVSYRTFGLAFGLFVLLHLWLPIVILSTSDCGVFAYFISKALLWSGSTYALALSVWIFRSTSDDFFAYRGFDRPGITRMRVSPYDRREDVRYVTFIWMIFGGTWILFTDVMAMISWRSSLSSFPWNLKPEAASEVWLWVSWFFVFASFAIFQLRTLTQFVTIGVEANIVHAVFIAERVRKIRGKVKVS